VVNAELNQVVTKRALITAAALIVGAWCAPVLASSGIEIHCPDKEAPHKSALVSAETSLTAHAESTVRRIPDDNVLTMPTLAETSVESVEVSDESESLEMSSAASPVRPPAITTRLPGVPDTSLPSFRRQMHRTDI